MVLKLGQIKGVMLISKSCSEKPKLKNYLKSPTQPRLKLVQNYLNNLCKR